MPGYKYQRIAQDVKRELALILPTLKDPRISGLLSIIRVEVTRDLSFAKINISSVEGFEVTKASVKGLTAASGYIRRELGQRLQIRKMPELIFVPDDSIEYSAHISELLGK